MTKFPYDDEYMIYNYRMHRYVLTDKAVFDILGENLNVILVDAEPVTKNAFLKKVSNTLYEYILSASQSPDYIEYIMAKDGSLREMIQDMLISQVEYMLANGAVDSYSGINMAKGHYIDLDKIRNGRQVSLTVEQKSNAILPGYGHCLRYACALPHIASKFYRVGY